MTRASLGQPRDQPPKGIDSLLASRERYLAFLRKRVADPELAEDVLQDALLRALRSAPQPADEERLDAWFYRVLRNAVVDTYRRQDVRGRHTVPLEMPLDIADREGEASRELCDCFRPLLADLRPEYAELIELLDLGDDSPDEVAKRLNLTRANVKVRRHRARRALRKLLEDTCRMCAAHGCLDCDCRAG